MTRTKKSGFSPCRNSRASRAWPTYTPNDPNTPEFLEVIRALQPDLLFSFYYRHMLKAPLLAIPTQGCLNLHGSYLPKYPGRCPTNWCWSTARARPRHAALHGREARCGGHRRPAQGADCVRRYRADAVREDDRGGREMFAEVLPNWRGHRPAHAAGSFAGLVLRAAAKPADGHFEWTWPATRIYNLVRAVTHPYPGAFTELGGRGSCCLAMPATGERRRAVPGTVIELRPEGPVVACGKGSCCCRGASLAGGDEALVHSLRTRRSAAAGDIV